MNCRQLLFPVPLVIYKVTDAVIEFGLTARGLDGNVINGKMTADITPAKDDE